MSGSYNLGRMEENSAKVFVFPSCHVAGRLLPLQFIFNRCIPFVLVTPEALYMIWFINRPVMQMQRC